MQWPPPANHCSKRAANFNPWTEAKVDTENPERGPLLLFRASWPTGRRRRQGRLQTTTDNEGVTEFVEIKNRGHGLTIDSGWREVADTALAFVKRFA